MTTDQTVAITAGASAPEQVVQECVDYLVERFGASVREVTFRRESVSFPLPRELRVLKAHASEPASRGSGENVKSWQRKCTSDCQET